MNRPHAPSQYLDKPQSTASPGVVVSCATGTEIGPAALERLEALDDVIFAALMGDADALDRSREMWSEVRLVISGPLLDESLAQYAKQALMVWDATRLDPDESLTKAYAALEVLEMVAED
jgi:hypothetical protein